jgi:hypothetical protein
MNDRKLHDFLKEAKGAVSASLARAPATLFFLAVAAAMPMQEAKAWTAQYENIGRQIGNEVGRNAGGGGNDSAARIAGLLGGVVGSVLTRPLDESARAAQEAKREEERARRDQERISINNQRRLDQAAMAGREKAIREQAYEQQRRVLQPGHVAQEGQSRWVRATPGASSSAYPQAAVEAQTSIDHFADVQRATGTSADVAEQQPRQRGWVPR